MSERMACRLAGLSRSAYRRPLKGETTDDPDMALRDWLRAWAKDHPRYGYRRAYHDARAEGWGVNHKKIQRLWREEGLRVPQRRRRKRVGSSTVDAPTADAPNVVWAVDFQFDADEQGRPIKICSIVDEHTRECIGGLTERSITADRLTAHLDDLVAVRGAPAVLRSDNGPEFISEAMADWAGTRTGLSYIPPGSPWRNGYVESFNSRIRDECLNINSFYSLLHAQVIIGDWKDEYNHHRRHSSLGYLPPAEYARQCTHQMETYDSQNVRTERRGRLKSNANAPGSSAERSITSLSVLTSVLLIPPVRVHDPPPRPDLMTRRAGADNATIAADGASTASGSERPSGHAESGRRRRDSHARSHP